jgi:thiamine pyrophosphate-dependent acetolactate synthase large subunit-like protein
MLLDALQKKLTTMTAVTAMKNRGYAILQDDEDPQAGANQRLDALETTLARMERNLARMAKAHGIELETVDEPEPEEIAKPTKSRKAN